MLFLKHVKNPGCSQHLWRTLSCGKQVTREVWQGYSRITQKAENTMTRPENKKHATLLLPIYEGQVIDCFVQRHRKASPPAAGFCLQLPGQRLDIDQRF